MVQLTLPLLDNTDNESGNSSLNCDPSQSIYDTKSCIKDFLFCSDDNPCPSKIPCIDRVCQCLPNTKSYITLTPSPVKMYAIGCNFTDPKRVSDSCRDYEYGVQNTCLLNYCSSQVPCYAGSCDNNRNVCVNITSSRKTLPTSYNAAVTLGDDPFGTNKAGMSPVVIIMMAAGAVVAIAIVGCVIRTTSRWTKRSFAWATGSQKVDPEGDEDEKTRKDADTITSVKDINDDDVEGDADSAAGSASAIARKPSKFTGRHYMPSPAPGLLPSEISPFPSPLPSPNFSPYSQTNQSQVSDSSMLNPFRQGAEDYSSVPIEMKNRSPFGGSPSAGSFGSMSASDRSIQQGGMTPEFRASNGVVGAGMEIVPAMVPMPPSRPVTPVGGSRPGTPTGAGMHPQISRSQSALSREVTPGSGFDWSNGLHKSMSMQQLGSRPAPPPPTSSSSSLSPTTAGFYSNSGNTSSQAPTIEVSHSSYPSRSSRIISQPDVMQAPYRTLDSLIDSPSAALSRPQSMFQLEADPSYPQLSPSARSSLVLQSGAERHPSLTIPAGQSMLRHSSSVPQMVVSVSSPPQSPVQQRILPAGFASSPLAGSSGRFES
ncbi:hypothetical protein EDD21DRAFT_387470 [Dissophora ornata]|nr:hypothetical protein BGZ58_000133 [Dissophora ornata]KAI8596703.1 hypothetical protein EDD21DRAFT_387470 [Dissophora ornata]